MYSEDSWDSGDVCVITRSCFDKPAKPYHALLRDYIQEACGHNPSKSMYCYESVSGGMAACVRCPPICFKDSEGRKTLKTDILVAHKSDTKQNAQQDTALAALRKLFEAGLLDELTARPTSKVLAPCIELGPNDAQMPLNIEAAAICDLPPLSPPASHPIIYLASRDDMPAGFNPIRDLLFPEGCPPTHADVIGFDVEWRPHLGRSENRAQWSATATGPAVPATVVQLSSRHATLVVNLFAMGSTLEVNAGAWHACAAAATLMLPVLEDDNLMKVGLACKEDLSRLQQLCSTFSGAGIIDCQGLAKELGFQKLGLRSLAAAVLGLQLPKGQAFADWQQLHFTDAMVKYAALDAYATRIVFERLLAVQDQMQDGQANLSPPRDVPGPPLRRVLHGMLKAGDVAGHVAPRLGSGSRECGRETAQNSAPEIVSATDELSASADARERSMAASGSGADGGAVSGRRRRRRLGGHDRNGGAGGQGTAGVGGHGVRRSQEPTNAPTAVGHNGQEGPRRGGAHSRRREDGGGRGGESGAQSQRRGEGGEDKAGNNRPKRMDSALRAGEYGSRRHRGRGISEVAQSRGLRELAQAEAKEEGNATESFLCFGSSMSKRLPGGGGKDGVDERKPSARGLAWVESCTRGVGTVVAAAAWDVGVGGGLPGSASRRWTVGGGAAGSDAGGENGGLGGGFAPKGAGGAGRSKRGGRSKDHPGDTDRPWRRRGRGRGPLTVSGLPPPAEDGDDRHRGRYAPPGQSRASTATRVYQRGKSVNSMGRRNDGGETRRWGGTEMHNDVAPDPRQVPTELYVRAEARALEEWRKGPAPPVAQLQDLRTESPACLPVSVPEHSVWDGLERYFFSVEEVSKRKDTGDCPWVSAWGIEELKQSAHYSKMLTYFGGDAV